MGIISDTPEDLARWAIAEHRSEVLDMARAVASGWDWQLGDIPSDGHGRAIALIAAAIVAAVDDVLDGGS